MGGCRPVVEQIISPNINDNNVRVGRSLPEKMHEVGNVSSPPELKHNLMSSIGKIEVGLILGQQKLFGPAYKAVTQKQSLEGSGGHLGC